MLRKSALFALAAAAAFGASMLVSTSSDAAPGWKGKGGGVHKPGGIHRPGGHVRPRPPHWRPHRPHRPHWHGQWRRPVIYAAAPVVYSVARPAVAGPCTCLSKEYTPEGAVLFKDRCTNEMAMNPPIQPQQLSQAAPQFSQQYVQPQYQAAPQPMPQQPVQQQ